MIEAIAEADNVTAVRAYIAETNLASQAAARSAGFQLVGQAECACPDGDRKAPALLFERLV